MMDRTLRTRGRPRGIVPTLALAVVFSSALLPGSPAYAQDTPDSGEDPFDDARPAERRYRPGEPVPAGYIVESRTRKGFMIAGPIVFGVSYGIALSIALDRVASYDRWLAVPLVGPFVAISEMELDACPGEWCVVAGMMVTSYIGLALAQIAGATLTTIGLTVKSKWVVPRQEAIRFGPQPVGSGYGVGAWGRF